MQLICSLYAVNRDCGPIKSKPALLAKIYGHKEKFLEKYIHIVKLDNLPVNVITP